MNQNNDYIKKLIDEGQAILGIEFGSTTIKAVLIDEAGNVLSTGQHAWENHFVDGIWTYPLDEVWAGLQSCYSDLNNNVSKNYGTIIKKLKSFGVSGMMHGYLPFDKDGNQLSEFRTWRNAITSEAADKLTEIFNYNIPQRWSIAHLYQAILNGEEHVGGISYLTTLAGYVHWKLTGKKVMGIGEASGMFPISIADHNFNEDMLKSFDKLIKDKNYHWKIKNILPQILVAGQTAGQITEEGAKLIDISRNLEPGIITCPPEGDAGTGMVATNSLDVRTGNVSAGTSAFAMLVLEKELSRVHMELDMVTTPVGDLVAMSHANNCTTEINSWVNLFDQCLKLAGCNKDMSDVYTMLFEESLNGDYDCGDLISYCFHSGEPTIGLDSGIPMFIHHTKSKFDIANFIRTQIYASFATMKLGMDILVKEENAKIDKILAHGGIFKTPGVAQRYLAAAIGTTVEVAQTASVGGPWGIALLAAYTNKVNNGYDKKLSDYLNEVFSESKVIAISPSQEEIDGYAKFIENFKQGLSAEVDAVNSLSNIEK